MCNSNGAVAQLGERRVRNAEVEGSIPFRSIGYPVGNLVDRRVEVYTGPDATVYASRVDFAPGQDVPVLIGGVQVGRITVDSMLP